MSPPLSVPVITAGQPRPPGATLLADGVNFTLFSRHADRVELCLFDETGGETRLVLPARSGNVFHGFVAGIGAGQRYGFRVYGENRPQQGLCFNPQKLLADPYARVLEGGARYGSDGELAWFRADDPRDNAERAPKSVVAAQSGFDWEGDTHPDIPWAQTVLYEAHVKGLTRRFPDLASGGTYAALADTRVAAYLKRLGVTALELLPLQQHADERHLQAAGLVNYWGYNTAAAFAVEPRYARQPENAADELRRAVKTLHAAGIEVVLDVVYNHSAEQDEYGPMLCQRGIDNASWYWLDEHGAYRNWSGCGNTLNLACPEVAQWVADNLRYWVREFHIDGFRFDLGTVLGRTPDFRADAPLLQIIAQDPLLSERKLIAEPWDLGGGGYQAGAFPAPFAEWNDRFRDSMRAFWLWQNGRVDTLAECLAGSALLMRRPGRRPSAGINFITAHDGFTLRDLVSYNRKHNEANGEHNADGHSDNISDNHGCEGRTDDEIVRRERLRSSKALLAALFLSAGTPMLTAGDEFGHSQQGNNNGYCQDNDTTWLDWPQFDAELAGYAQSLTALRREIGLLADDCWWDGRAEWFTADGTPMGGHDWHDTGRKALQVLLDGEWLLLANGKRSQETFRLPEKLPESRWQCRSSPEAADTAADTFSGSLKVPCIGIWVLRRTV